MFVAFIWAKRKAAALAAIALLGAACSAVPHDCYETRSCPEAEPVLSGSGHGGGNAGGAGKRGALLGAAGSTENGGSSEADAGAASVTELPSVHGVSPSDGARGVARDVRIVVAFSRPMDTAATEAGYESSDLPATALSFSWNENATLLTLIPRAPLDYALNPPGASESPELPALVYEYGFSARATDQLGQALAPVHFSFSTLRQISVQLEAEPERTGNWTPGKGEGIHNCLRKPNPGYEPTVCIGDDSNNSRYSGFLSFDLGVLPEAITQVTSAHLLADGLVHGAPAQLGPSQLEHVAYAELDERALSIAPISAPSSLFVAATLIDGAPLTLDLNVTAEVADDYENRSSRGARSQYRLAFAKVLANTHWDDVEVETSRIQLALSYLLP